MCENPIIGPLGMAGSTREGSENLGARSQKTLSFRLEEWSRITWEVQSKDYDIGLGALFMPDSGSADVTVMALQRVDSHIVPQFGTFSSRDRSGTLIMTLDNSFSLLRGKTASWRCSIDTGLPREMAPDAVTAPTIVRTRMGPAILRERRPKDGSAVVVYPWGGIGYVIFRVDGAL